MKKNIKKNLIMTPLPVLIIGTYDENGTPNAMNAAWGVQSEADEITIFLSKHKTTDNLKLKKAFTVAFATEKTLVESDYFGIESGSKVNKIEKVGFHAKKAEFVDAPIFDEYPLSLECEVVNLYDDNGDFRLVGKVKNVVAEESILDAEGKVDLNKVGIIAYDSTHHTYRLLGDVVGKAFHDGMAFKK